MANVAPSTHRGTVIDMESYRISSAEAVEVQTSQKTASGPAGIATAPCATRDRSGLLSDAEREKLARIRRNRNQGWMATFEEFDFLLEMVEGFTHAEH